MTAALLAMLKHLPRLLLVVVIALAVRGVFQAGERAGAAEVQGRWDQQTIAGLTTDRNDLAGAIRRTAELGDQLDTIQSTNRQGHADAKRTTQNLIADLRAGRISLSIPAAPASAADVSGTAAASGGAAGPGQARTRLDTATAANLVGITDDGDAAIRDLNTCIDAFATVRERVNGTGAAP